MPGELTVPNIGTDSHDAIIDADIRERKLIDADERIRREYVNLHQINQRRSSREEHGTRLRRYREDRIPGCFRIVILEWLHIESRTFRTAASMLG